MESKILIPLLASFIGVIIGALSSIFIVWLQQRAQTRRESLKLSCEMALEDRKNGIEFAKAQNKDTKIMPIVVYQHFHLEVLNALEKGSLTDKKILEIKTKNKKFMQALERFYK